MLYQIYEAQRSLLEPFSEMAQAASRVFTNPSMPVSHLPYAKRIAAGYGLMHRLAKNYEKPQFGITSVFTDGVEVSIHERVEMDKPFCKLLRFKRYADDAATLQKLLNHPAVLIVAPLSGHYATLLRDTVRTMLQDHKVYITDWVNARDVPVSEGRFNLDDYVNYVQEFIRKVQADNGECHVISVCQPTVPVMAAVSLMAARGEQTPSSMVIMGGPVDATQSPTAVNDLATQRSLDWFENNVIYRVPANYEGAGRRVYPGFLQFSGFIAMNPNRHATSHYDYFQDLIQGDGESAEAHRRFYDEYNAVLDMDADFYLDTIGTVFQDFKLVKGTWDVVSPEGKTERVRPQAIRNTAVLAVEGELDDIAGLGQTQASLALCTNVPEEKKQYYKVMGAGHYGIFSGRRWREKCYPVLREFILRHHMHIVAPQRLHDSRPMMENLERREMISDMLAATAPGAAPKTPAVGKPRAKAQTKAADTKKPASAKAAVRKTAPAKRASRAAPVKAKATTPAATKTTTAKTVPASRVRKPATARTASKPVAAQPVTTWRGPAPAKTRKS
ncbi:MAG: polyhydroxyalkanoate depolymerase [Brachymonas sp.]|nr:polyhydroxyalkanoate depolymerase [Brachymonas sp.]